MDKATSADPPTPACITTRETPYGLWWRYRHAEGEPDATLTAVIMIACEVAGAEARRRGKTYVVASTPRPDTAVYVFACDHPDARAVAFNLMFEFTPDGQRIRHPGYRTAVRQ